MPDYASEAMGDSEMEAPDTSVNSMPRLLSRASVPPHASAAWLQGPQDSAHVLAQRLQANTLYLPLVAPAPNATPSVCATTRVSTAAAAATGPYVSCPLDSAFHAHTYVRTPPWVQAEISQHSDNVLQQRRASFACFTRERRVSVRGDAHSLSVALDSLGEEVALGRYGTLSMDH